jgi:hypothetical protein
MHDIVERARQRNIPYGWPELVDKLAFEIERLRTELDLERRRLASSEELRTGLVNLLHRKGAEAVRQ